MGDLVNKRSIVAASVAFNAGEEALDADNEDDDYEVDKEEDRIVHEVDEGVFEAERESRMRRRSSWLTIMEL